MKLSTKIAASMGCLAVLMAIMGGYLIMQTAKINDSYSMIVEQMMPIRSNAGDIDKAATAYRLNEVLHLYATDPAAMKRYEERQEKWAGVVAQGIKNLEGLLFRPAAKQAFQAYLAVRQAYMDTHQRLLTLSRENRTQEAVALLNGDSRAQYDAMDESLEQMVQVINKAVAEANAAGDAMYAASRLIGICLTLAGSFGSGLAFCREKSRHAGTLFLLAELFLRMAEEIGYSAERLPDVFSQRSVWLAKDAENDSFGKEEASALAEALLHCADRLEQERSEPLEVVWNAELGAWAAQTVLSREEAKKLLSFAKEQGFPDRERQRQWMLRLSGEFKSRAESVFEKAASEKRMVLSVSLAAGALVVVLFW